MATGLIMSSSELKRSNLTVLGHLENHLNSFKRLDSVILSRSEFDNETLRDYFEKRKTMVLQMTPKEVSNNPQIIKVCDVVILNILGFFDSDLENLETLVSNSTNNRLQTYRLFRWIKQTEQISVELLDFNNFAVNARFRRITVTHSNGEQAIAISSPIYSDTGWGIQVEKKNQTNDFWLLNDIDLTPFYEILF